jgi:8-oxo-dGTP pyrophosphatase MutT (NUDIX family)
MNFDDPTFLAALQAAIAHDDANNADRVRLMPLFADGSAARSVGPPPGVTPRRGAVLALLYPADGELFVPLTVRAGHLRTHTGEISLPGGAIDPGDESVAAAALREGHEEVGLHPATVRVLGTLTDVYIAPSNFQITPVVGWSPAPPALTPDSREVAAILHLPLRLLLRDDAITIEERLIREQRIRVPFYAFGEHQIWGATSIVLSQLAARLRPVIGGRV